jgi:NlpC/P60 family putative phage cell wall peptidase
MNAQIPRERIVAQARLWINTPYQHQMSRRGAGCDCLGLVRGVWREIYGDEPLAIPAYTPNWSEQSGEETLRDAARKCLTKITIENAQPGDILLFRMAVNSPAKHIAIISTPRRMIHAYWGRSVIETLQIPYWLRRRAYGFSFPPL